MPLFVHALVAWSRRRPALALLGSGLLGWLLYWHLPPVPPAVRPVVAKAQPLPGLGVERAVMEKTLLDVQKENAQLKGTLQEQERTLHQIQQALSTAERERQTAAATQEQRLEDILKRAQQVQRPAPAPTPRVAAVPKPPPTVAKPTPQPSETARDSEHGVKVRILRSEKAASFPGPPPSVLRADTPYLPAGSFAEGRVITGVMATSRAGGALPMLFAVTKAFDAPFQLQGTGRNPVATALPMHGCFLLGKAQADLGASRVLIQLEVLSCVFPDQATFERPLKGYAVGIDGTLGLVGRVETHDTAILAKTFLTSLLAGASEAFALAKRTVIVTPLGGTTSTQNGQVGETAGFSALATAAAQLSHFYLQQASQLLPTLWVESGTPARLVLQEGLPLEGFPTTTMLSSRGLP
jgi:conjugal transfer pilus assembly protein TraB